MENSGTGAAGAEQLQAAPGEGQASGGSEAQSAMKAIENAAAGRSGDADSGYDTIESLEAELGEAGDEGVEGAGEDIGKPEPAKDAQGNYLASWKTKSEAERGIAELQRFATQSRQELADLRRLMEASQGREGKPTSEKEVNAQVEEFLANPSEFAKKYGGAMTADRLGSIVTAVVQAQTEFDTVSGEAQVSALKRVDSEFGDALTSEVLELRSQLLTPGYDPLMTRYMGQINAGNYKTGANGKPIDLEEYNFALIQMATEKAIARCHGKIVQKTKAEVRRDTKRVERKTQRLGVQTSGGRNRDFRTKEQLLRSAETLRNLNAAAKSVK